MSTNASRSTSRTIMVPLRDVSSPTEERKRSNRGRGSQSATPKARRSATPVRKASRSRSRRQSVTDLNITVLGDEGDSNDWTRQRSPRKRKPTPTRKSKPTLDAQGLAEDAVPVGRSARRTRRVAQPIEIREDPDAQEEGLVGEAVDSDSPELRSIDLNRVAVRSRSMSTKRQPAIAEGQDISSNEGDTDQDEDICKDDPRTVSVISTSYPTPDPSVQGDQASDEPAYVPSDPPEGFDTILESEGFTMIDLESIPSVRKLLSSPTEVRYEAPPVDYSTSLYSNKGDQSEMVADRNNSSALPLTQPVPSAIPAYLTLQEGESDISSNVPSSPPIISQPSEDMQRSSAVVAPREITPQVYSSPKLPSPPKVLRPYKDKDSSQPRKSTPTLAKVVKAGIALQGVLSPRSTNTAHCTPGPSPEERLNNLFEGFDSGTRRELRAGLRLGEELAKRQRSSPDVERSSKHLDPTEKITDHANHEKVFGEKPVPVTQVWRGATIVQDTPLQLPTNEGWTANRSATAITNQTSLSTRPRRKSLLREEIVFTSSTPQANVFAPKSNSIDDTQMRQEYVWQREREEVSKEIENASSTQVVVIDSDNEDENAQNAGSDLLGCVVQGEQTELDIWCEEAASCDQRSSKAAARPIRACQAEILPEREQKVHDPDARDGSQKPRRSLIPSPWRRGNDAAIESSYLTNGDMTGLFYHEPKTKIKFGATEIERQRRHFSSGSFDIDRMAGTPTKEHVVGSHTAANEGSGVESIDSDAQQLQAELNMNHTQAEDMIDQSQPDSEDTNTQQSLVEEEAGSQVELLGQSTDGEISLSLPPQPVKIPVKFNDSTLSHRDVTSCLTRSSPSAAPGSSRPSTPRSALKGARQSLSHEHVNSRAVRKVIFSTHEIRVSLDGQEEQLSMQSVSSCPEVAQGLDNAEDAQDSLSEVRGDSPPQTSGLLGWLWGGSKKSKSDASITAETSNDRGSRTETSTPRNPPRAESTAIRVRTPSFLLPPSYPSDPRRDTRIPMPTSGEFTNSHFRTLHIIYAKSLRPRFHAPKAHEVRPSLRTLLGTLFEADESQAGLGVFEWRVDEMALRVVERFMKEIEWGYPRGSTIRWVWTEKEICERLFRIIVGEEVRKEEKAALARGTAGNK